MIYAFKHHRAVIDRIVDLHDRAFDFATGFEPVTQKAYDNAMRLLSRRPDLTIGMSVTGSRGGGLRLDLLRFGREYMIEIDDKGKASLMTGTDAHDRDPISLVTKSINQVFLAEIEQHMPDPYLDEAHAEDLVPPAGMLAESRLDGAGIYDVKTDRGGFLGLQNANARYGFDVTCFRIPQGVEIVQETMIEALESVVRTGRDILVGRRLSESPLVALHDITTCPVEIIRNAKLSCGRRLVSLQSDVAEARNGS